MLSVSIDPENDTPEVLHDYWETFGSKPGWLFLTGDYDEIDVLRRSMGVYDLDPVLDADKSQHAGLITFGNDRTDRWAALPALMDAPGLAETVLRITRDARPLDAVAELPRDGGATVHHTHGVVRQLPGNGRVVVDHEEIPGFMRAMTMTFEVADASLLQDLTPGQEVELDIEFTDGSFRLTQIAPRRTDSHGLH